MMLLTLIADARCSWCHDKPPVPSKEMGGKRKEEEVPLRRKRSFIDRARQSFNTLTFAQFHTPLSADVLPHAAISESAGPSTAADKGKAPMLELDIPAEFLVEYAQARQRLEEEQASERLVQRLRAEDLAKEDLPNVSEERAKELDDLMMRMTETDWLNLMMQSWVKSCIGTRVVRSGCKPRRTDGEDPPSLLSGCVLLLGKCYSTVPAGLRESYDILHQFRIIVLYNVGVSACTARQVVFSSPWLTAKKESGSPLQTALVCNSNPLMVPVQVAFLLIMFLAGSILDFSATE
ncbi:hypothetical protein Tco_1300358 [Tanacetum coccineum]